MKLMDVVRVVREWRALALLGVIATLATSALTFNAIGPTYQRTGSVVIVPGNTIIPEGGNPFVYLGGLSQAADVLVAAAGSSAVIDPIIAAHPGTTINVERDFSTSGPMVNVAVTGSVESHVAAAFTSTVAQLSSSLGELQTTVGVPESARMSILALDVDNTSTRLEQDRLRGTAVVGVGGLASTLSAIALLNGVAPASWKGRGRWLPKLRRFNLRSGPSVPE